MNWSSDRIKELNFTVEYFKNAHFNKAATDRPFISFISKEYVVGPRHQLYGRKVMDKLQIDLQGSQRENS